MKKILLGCAITGIVGCLLLVGGGFLVAHWAQREFGDVEGFKDGKKEMVERFGDREDFVPPLDGSLNPDRVDLFIALREELKDKRDGLAAEASDIIQEVQARKDSDRGHLRKFLDKINSAKRGFTVLKNGFAYVKLRTRTLLDADMSEGEYIYLYGLTAFAWVRWDPVEQIGEEALEEYEMGDVAEQFWNEYRKIFVKQLKNQRRGLRNLDARTARQDSVLQSLQDVLDEAMDNRHAYPFEEQLPEEWLQILSPYRERFTVTLAQTPVEFIVEAVAALEDNDDEGGIQIKIGH